MQGRVEQVLHVSRSRLGAACRGANPVPASGLRDHGDSGNGAFTDRKINHVNQVWHASKSSLVWLIRSLKVREPATPSPALAHARHDGINRQNATFTPSVMLRPISGAAVLMNEVCAYAKRSVRLLAFRYTCQGVPLLNWPL